MPSEIHTRLITANQILHYHNLLDGVGSVSVRSVGNQHNFLMADCPSVMVSSASDILELRVDDGSSTDSSQAGPTDRCIHSELYKRFPSISGIVMSSSSEVLPYTTSGVPLKPMSSMAGFLGLDTPVWDINSTSSMSVLSSSTKNDMQVSESSTGTSLARAFHKSSSTAGSIYNKASSLVMGSSPAGALTPDYSVMLLRGLGMCVIGASLEEAVFEAIYTAEAAKAQTNALLTSALFAGGKVEGKVDVEGGGYIKNGKVKMAGDIQFLSKDECAESWKVHRKNVSRTWRGWEWEVSHLPMYRNMEKE